MDWYLNFSPDMSDVPAGYAKLPHISDIDPADLLSESQIATLVQGAPAGSYWSVGGEPNRTTITGEAYADVFHYYYVNIRANDITAKITGPSILNWDFTCVGCGGYVRGDGWLMDFIETYQAHYGKLPPVDVWAIDLYPIDWNNLPNNDPDQPADYKFEGRKRPHTYIVIKQIEHMRDYLNQLGYADTPIWVTEIAIHVGYDWWRFEAPNRIVPVEPYYWDLMADYVNTVLDLFEDNAESYNIEKWFFFVTWMEPVNVDAYMGIIFFDGPGQDAQLNCLGEVYRARALGWPRLTCSFEGDVVRVE